MADARVVWGDAARWYPEVVAMGDTIVAWQAEFEGKHIPLRVGPRESPNPHRTATVKNGELHADLLLSPWERRFRLALRSSGFTLLQGYAADLGTAADAAALWLSGARPGQVAAAWPFLGSVALAEARERGDHRESSWLWLYENHCANPVGTRLRAFLALAFHEPRLRVLRPYTSHWTLRFSRSPEWPFDHDLPAVDPAITPDRYVVRMRDRRAHDETDASGALRLLLAELPD
ncbi:DUF6193 family natural product biosynthesis protein [Micromonospora sp. NBC_01796]|uniref:DUF6193 family natural product biosynthesis protein n=1 Tax=Micromonospora sp. NBC_01796 TaxID=2975987 RepID=UPI002DD86885|nr:DUF6193 family natural product biosynthesis protein [Micromonospora sp. NBC_01796]WSA85159.1 DUF6193 family natural product biosynthesis protein [Micromonospora sp. NBC_01796]